MERGVVDDEEKEMMVSEGGKGSMRCVMVGGRERESGDVQSGDRDCVHGGASGEIRAGASALHLHGSSLMDWIVVKTIA